MSKNFSNYRFEDPFFDALSKHINEVVIILDNNLGILFFNQHAEKLFFQLEANIFQQSFEKICIDNHFDFFIQPYLSIIEKQRSVAIKPGANNFGMAWHFDLIKHNGHEFYLLMTKGLEEKENQNEILKLETLIENLPCNVYWIDKNCIMAGCNENVLNMLDISQEEFKGKSYDQLGEWCHWPPGLAASLKKDDLYVLKTGIPIIAKEDPPLPNAAGGEYQFLTSRVPLRNRNGDIVGIAGISTDVSDLKSAKKRAELSEQAKTIFIANMSHDIRTPLSGVIGLAGILEHELDKPIQKKHAQNIAKSGEQLLIMLNKIISAISSGHLTVNDLHEEPFDLDYLVKGIVELKSSNCALKKIDLFTDIDTSIPPVLIGDHEKIQHILLNLVSNAIKFTLQGQVKIRIKLLKLTKKKSFNTVRLLFEVSDTGIGIPEEAIKNIFELFYKVTPSYKEKDNGHGIGLHIVKTYTQLLGGHIRVETVPNQGSKFSVTLSFKVGANNDQPKNITLKPSIYHSSHPPAKQVNLNEDVKISPDLSDLSPKILIIDDDAIMRTVLESIVKQGQCHSTLVKDGESALELIKKQDFDLIFSDIGLPGISGIQFAQEFRKHEKKYNKKMVPIVGLTGHAEGDIHEQCLVSGMDLVIIKPFSPDMFAEICENFNLFDREKQEKWPLKPICDTTLGVSKIGALGVGLPDKESELLRLDSLPVFDIIKAKNLLGNDTVLLKNLLKNIINQTIPQALIQLKKYYAIEDWKALAELSHKLKSACLSLALTRAATACQYLEFYEHSGQKILLKKLYTQLIKTLQLTLDILKPVAN